MYYTIFINYLLSKNQHLPNGIFYCSITTSGIIHPKNTGINILLSSTLIKFSFSVIVLTIFIKSSSPSVLFWNYLNLHFQSSQTTFTTNRRNPKQTRKPLYYHAKLGYYHGNSRLLRDSIILPQSPSYQRHQKRKKERFTNHSDEPLYAQNSLILSHSSILSPANIPNSYGINWKLPPVPLLYFDDFYPSLPHLPHPIRLSTNGIRQNPLAFMRNPA